MVAEALVGHRRVLEREELHLDAEVAGLRQRDVGGRIDTEGLLIRPPRVLVKSDYRSGQMSAEARWLNRPVLKSLPSWRLRADGRRWTCFGPTLIPEIERLRRELSR